VISVGCAVAFTASALVFLVALTPRLGIARFGAGTDFQSIGFSMLPFWWWDYYPRDWLNANPFRSALKAATQSLATLRALHERIVESIRSGLVTLICKGESIVQCGRRRNYGL